MYQCKARRAEHTSGTERFALLNLRHKIFLPLLRRCWNLIVLNAFHCSKNFSSGDAGIAERTPRRRGGRDVLSDRLVQFLLFFA